MSERRVIGYPHGDFAFSNLPLSDFIVRRPFDRRQADRRSRIEHPSIIKMRQVMGGENRYLADRRANIYVSPYCDTQMPSGYDALAWQCCGEVGHAIRQSAKAQS